MTENVTGTAILHVVDKPEDVTRAVTAATFLVEAHPGLHVRIIVNGPALEGVTKAAETVTPDGATTVEACETGMHRRDMDPGQLQPAIHTVESAVIALVEAQLAGAAYVRM